MDEVLDEHGLFRQLRECVAFNVHVEIEPIVRKRRHATRLAPHHHIFAAKHWPLLLFEE
jgi:hypothetical protein